MDEIEVSTVVYLPPEDVYDVLLDFPRYETYSKHLTDVRAFGDGDVGTVYDLEFAWWKLTYTLRSRVTDVDPPSRIDWEVVEDLHAHGNWLVETAPAEAAENAPGEPPEAIDSASRVTLQVSFDADSAHAGMLDLPVLVSLDWVVDKVRPLVESEARRVVSRVVADLEGESRDVDLEIRT